MRKYLSVAVVLLVSTFSISPSVALAEPIAIPPDGYAAIYGSQSDWFECWSGKIGTRIDLQTKVNGQWKTVLSTKFRKNRALCPDSIARFSWTVDTLGPYNGTSCGINTYRLELRTYVPSARRIGSVWAMEQYASRYDHTLRLLKSMDSMIKGIPCI